MENNEEELIDSWDFVSVGKNDYEIIMRVQLAFCEPTKWSRPLLFIFDTGYDGDILLTNEIWDILGYDQNKKQEDYWRYGETISGEIIELKSSITHIRIKEKEFEIIVESGNVAECLIGRKLILQFITRLDGPNRLLSLFEK